MEKYFIKQIEGKMMLCSRDIQVGDIVLHPPTGRKTEVIDEKMINEVLRTGGIKVIGEVSSDALPYVKEGDEFDEDQINITPLYKKQYPDEWDQPVELLRNDIRIKCPWGHFH